MHRRASGAGCREAAGRTTFTAPSGRQRVELASATCNCSAIRSPPIRSPPLPLSYGREMALLEKLSPSTSALARSTGWGRVTATEPCLTGTAIRALGLRTAHSRLIHRDRPLRHAGAGQSCHIPVFFRAFPDRDGLSAGFETLRSLPDAPAGSAGDGGADRSVQLPASLAWILSEILSASSALRLN